MIITTIGAPQSGKSTALYFLAENILEDGKIPTIINNLKDLVSAVNRGPVLKPLFYSIQNAYTIEQPTESDILIDDPTSEMLEFIQSNNGVIVRVNRNIYNKDHQIIHTPLHLPNIHTQFFITSLDESLRLLSFDVKRIYLDIKKYYDNIAKRETACK